ncbi:MAG: polysaccharide deacetylase family protein, partial [Dehalococcoidia bacterium]
TRRLLKLFERYDLRTSWFIPGHSIETFPRQVQQIVEAGHEIGAHGYLHENPVSIHPDVSGRPQVLLMLERLIEYISGHEGVRWVTMEEVAEDFCTRYPFSERERPEDR